MDPAVQPSKTLWIVEESAPTREALASIFRSEGYEVVTPATEREALDRLRRGTRPAVILLDRGGAPQGGRGLLEERRGDAGLASIPVVVMTEKGGDPRGEAALGATARLQKPVSVNTLVRLIQSCV